MDKFTLPKLSHNLEDKFKIDHSPFLLDPGPIILRPKQRPKHTSNDNTQADLDADAAPANKLCIGE